MACVHPQTEKRKDKKLGSYKQLPHIALGYKSMYLQ